MALACFPLTLWAEYGLNMPRGVTPISKEVYDLHMLILWICVVIAIVVFGVMFWAILAFRKSRGAVADTNFTHSTKIEVMWTLIPILILVAMAVPATKTLIKMEDTSEFDLTVKVTGYQWKWRYDYIEDGIGFFSVLGKASNDARQKQSGIDPASVDNYLLEVDRPLVLPINKKIRILTTANDVLHSWWVPVLGWKRDAIPGFINSSWTYIEEPGTYRGQCAELCGRDHAFMPVVLEAVSESDYDQWVEEQKVLLAAAASDSDRNFSVEELLARGAEVYGTNCAACHQANGQGLPGAFPGLAGSAIAIGSVEDHIDIVLNGKAGSAMAAFGSQLNDADLAAVITYERLSWGNEELLAPDQAVVQPSDIKAARSAN
ncbi:MAG: cytochrome c oxidase subunit II [Candidatus Porifericomitaceae bacterium WSBS_2022_MAG_OTU9]